MSDDFYGDFDREVLRDGANRERKADYRSIFHQDRDRIMFATAFRRLQGKTQVFQAGEYDFYRTRLTHSLEVATVAKSIARWLQRRRPEVVVDPELLEAICLAHDIGHPPFGHSGERMLNEVMAPYGGFEGNAQTLRILTRTIYGEAGGRGGMSPSRALIDGVLKYKRLYRHRAGEPNHFIYDDQAPLLEFCFQTDDLPAALGGAPVNGFKSLECQIMDLADDLSYSSFDIVDGVKARFLTPARLREWAAEQKLDEAKAAQLDQLIELIEQGRVEPGINRLIGQLIESVDLKPVENFMSARTRRYGWQLVQPEETTARFKLHKALCRDLIFGASALQQIEFKGRMLLRKLAEALLENYLHESRPATLLPGEVHRAVRAADSPAARARLLCDHLSGMTDAYALRSYKRLFDPGFGSISELI